MTNSTPIKKNGSWFLVNGTCMSPLIRQGDLVMTVPTKAPKFGDVVVVTSDPVIVHRVVRVHKTEYVETKGDASFKLDAPVSSATIAGIVTAVARKGGKTVSIRGGVWQATNRLLAIYSYASFFLYRTLSRYQWSFSLCKLFSPLMLKFHRIILRVISLFTINRAIHHHGE